ncbi:phosphotransferase [Actinosynnema sp. NPDC023587]|uniref:phosphotransferase n=1 Tax=Actinosynnema sp. NPDC023587 TaxID=3154695 RepID=UPI0033E14D0E
MTSRPSATENDFTVDRTRPLLQRACAAIGLDARDAQVLRHHTNAVYLVGDVPNAVVVKISRPGSNPQQSLSNARGLVSLVAWLTRHRVPISPLLHGVEQPVVIDNHVVTFWHHLPQDRPVSTEAIAKPLLALHQALQPSINLPAFDPITAITRSADASRILSDEHKVVIREKLDGLRTFWAHLVQATSPCLIHTDPQHRNTLWRPATGGERAAVRGFPTSAILCDLDGVTLGPVEWDLVTVEVHCRRFGHADYETFAAAYGRDVREWQGYPKLRALRELRMITTNARKSQPGSPQAAEVIRRVHSIDEDVTLRWNII